MKLLGDLVRRLFGIYLVPLIYPNNLCVSVSDITIEMSQLSSKVQFFRLCLGPLKRKERVLKAEFEEHRESLEKIQQALTEEKENVKTAKVFSQGELSNAQASVEVKGGRGLYSQTYPPQKMVKNWENEGINKLSAEEAVIAIRDTHTELDNLEDVDPKKVEQYRDIKESITYAEEELRDWEECVKSSKQTIEETRVRFLVKLEAMVEQISQNFSRLLTILNFAGCVTLDKGKHHDDFTNYGFDVMVKFREKLPLQRLDPFKY